MVVVAFAMLTNLSLLQYTSGWSLDCSFLFQRAKNSHSKGSSHQTPNRLVETTAACGGAKALQGTRATRPSTKKPDPGSQRGSAEGNRVEGARGAGFKNSVTGAPTKKRPCVSSAAL